MMTVILYGIVHLSSVKKCFKNLTYIQGPNFIVFKIHTCEQEEDIGRVSVPQRKESGDEGV